MKFDIATFMPPLVTVTSFEGSNICSTPAWWYRILRYPKYKTSSFALQQLEAYPGIHKGVGNLKPFQQGRIYFHGAKGGQVNSLKTITSVFRPKSSEEQKKVLTPSGCPLYVAYSLPPLHHESFVHLPAKDQQTLGIFPPQKAWLRHCSTMKLCRAFFLMYTIYGRVLNN